MESVEITVAFQITDLVFFKGDADFGYTVRGYLTMATGPTRYLCFHPSTGEVIFDESELEVRSIF